MQFQCAQCQPEDSNCVKFDQHSVKVSHHHQFCDHCCMQLIPYKVCNYFLQNRLHAAHYFFSSYKSNPLHFLKSIYSLLYTRQSTICLHSDPHDPSPHPPSLVFFKICFYIIIIPFMPRSSRKLLSFRFSTKILYVLFPLSNTLQISSSMT